MESTPIRIAQIIGRMCAGGVESVVFNYYRSIDKSKVQFDFFYDSDSTIEPPRELIEMGAQFYKLPPYKRVFSYCKKLKEVLKENQYRCVHSHLNTISVIPLFVAWQTKVPVRIAHNHSVPSGKELKRDVLKNILKRVAKIFPTHFFACSEKAGEWLFGKSAHANGEIFVLRNAIDFERFEFSEDKKRRLKNELGLKDELIVGHIGRFTYAKNHMFLLKIFAEILKIHPSSKLILVGDGELKDVIQKQIDLLKLNDSVILIGTTSKPEDYYSLFDVMVMPSVFEGLPVTVIEAQASRIPMLVSEAIVDEAIISSGIERCSLRNSEKEWAKKALSLINKTVEIHEHSNFYKIDKQAALLCEWYLNNCSEGKT